MATAEKLRRKAMSDADHVAARLKELSKVSSFELVVVTWTTIGSRHRSMTVRSVELEKQMINHALPRQP